MALRVVNTTLTTNIEDLDSLVVCAAKHPPPIKKKKRVLRQRQTHRFNHLRIKHPNLKACHYLAYPNGKVVVLGCRSRDDIEEALSWLAHATGTTKPLTHILHNIVGNFKFDKPINLSDVYNKILSKRGPNQYIGYFEPEMSPALVFAPLIVKRVRCLLFRSGSVIITGARGMGQLYAVHEELLELLAEM